MMDYGMNRLRRLGGLNMLGDAVNATPNPDQSRPGYWWNDQRIDPSQPFNKRFAGGQLDAAFVPYSGDPKRYGYGAQHRYNQVDPTRFGTNTTTGTATPTAVTDPGNYQQQQGGPDSGDVAERNPGHHGKAFSEMTDEELSAYENARNNGNLIQRNIEWGVPSILASLGLSALEKSQFSAERNARDAAFDAALSASIEAARGSPEAQAERDSGQIGNSDSDRSAAQAAAPEGERGSPETGTDFAEGGIVPGDDVHGEDDRTINADGGEGVIRADPMTQLGKPFLDALNKEDFRTAYDILGHILGMTEDQEEAAEEVAEGETPDMDDRGRMEEEIARRGEITRVASPSGPPTA